MLDTGQHFEDERDEFQSIFHLVQLVRVSMSVEGRDSCGRDACGGQPNVVHRQPLFHTSTRRAIDAVGSCKSAKQDWAYMIDELVLDLESENFEDFSCDQLSLAFHAIKEDAKKYQVLQTARAECRQVRRWLDLLTVDVLISVEVVAGLKTRTTSWSEIKGWTDEVLACVYGIRDSCVQRLILQRVAEHLDVNRLLRVLYQKVVEPISHVLDGNGEELLIVPDGDLFTVPWSALQNDCGEYLIEHHTVRIAPSIRLARAAAMQGDSTDTQNVVCRQGHITEVRTCYTPSVCDMCKVYLRDDKHCSLTSVNGATQYFWCALCNVDFCQKWSSVSVDGSQSKAVVVGNPLPNQCGGLKYAEEEATSTFITLQKSKRFRTVEVATRQHATKEWVLHTLKHAAWAHFACHARMHDNALVLADVHDIDEGLSMHEIQTRIQLVPGSTVILSACNTGRGDVKCDGIVGLCRGFLAAKAGAVVVSLWSVQDESTKILMSYFYVFLESGFTVPQALRLAMLRMCDRQPILRVFTATGSTQDFPVPGADDEREECLHVFSEEGRAEYRALQHIYNEGKEFSFNGTGMRVGNGISEEGRLSKEACKHLFGICRYSQLWGRDGLATRKSMSHTIPDAVFECILSEIGVSKQIRARTMCMRADSGKALMLCRMSDSLIELEQERVNRKIRDSFDSNLESSGRTVSDSSDCEISGDCCQDSVRGGPRKDLRGYLPLGKRASPLHWAGFLVSGASTTLPSVHRGGVPLYTPPLPPS